MNFLAIQFVLNFILFWWYLNWCGEPCMLVVKECKQNSKIKTSGISKPAKFNCILHLTLLKLVHLLIFKLVKMQDKWRYKWKRNNSILISTYDSIEKELQYWFNFTIITRIKVQIYLDFISQKEWKIMEWTW